MRPFSLALGLTAIVALAGAAHAEEADRYRLEKTDTGYVRMDTKTGAMSICEEKTGQLICRVAADERAALEGDIDRLQENLAALEKRVMALESRAIPEAMLPSEEEFEKSLGYMEQFFRRFMGVVEDFEKKDDAQKT